ncbi:monovalent cation/H+ antiporter complex subunit F [Actinomycetaceae bacterium L2_0104]
MIWIVSICGVMLFISAFLVLWRINDGPNTLDRMVGVDVMTSIMLGALALLVAMTRRSDLLAVFVVVSVVGFLGSVSVSRAARPDDPGKRRILTIEEERAIAAAEDEDDDDDTAAPVHPDGSDEEDADG